MELKRQTKIRCYLKQVVITILCSFLPLVSFTQSLENIRSVIRNNIIEIRYDLVEDQVSEARYEIYVYSSHNQFTSPLEKVTGDVGKDISTGLDKLIIWDPKSELSGFQGEISFQVVLNIFIPYVSFINPIDGSSIKRGNTNIIKWRGGNANDKLQLELYQNNTRIRVLQSIDNIGEFNWAVPKDIKPGKDYQLKATSITNSDFSSFSKSFEIKRKVPLMFIIAPAAVVVGVVILLWPEGTPENQSIPDPPNLN